jgi:hypothetical protein
MNQPTQTCRSCGALLYMAISEKSGKAMPINAEPAEHGNVLMFVREGQLYARVLKAGEQVEQGRRRWLAHFTNCPQATQWRRR